MINFAEYERELAGLKAQHSDLESEMKSAMHSKIIDCSTIVSLKRRKTILVDAIKRLEDLLFSGDSAA